MSKHSISQRIQLPQGWSSRVKSTLLQVISLAQYAMAYTRSWAVKGPIARLRLKAENDQLRQQVTLLKEKKQDSDQMRIRC